MSTPLTFPSSENWSRRGKRVDAWAATRDDILEIDDANFLFPQYVERASGAYLWDVDGNRYIDFILGYGPVVLGHAHPVVDEAVRKQLECGTCISPLWSPRQVELAELLTEVIPGAERAYLMRTGSDATAAAVRLARIHTGRDKVVKWGYNGWHDWTAPRPAGVPASTRGDTLTFDYNDLESLESVLDAHPLQVACVIMMTYELEPPSPGFLAGVKEAAHRHGAMFVLDEMRSGFRIALGGAQEHFGVEPDLSTFSKAMANGYAISAVVGRAEILDELRHTHMSSTFYGNPAEMAAALATIAVLRDTKGPARLWRLGQYFVEELEKVVVGSSLPAEVVGLPVSPFLRFKGDDAAETQRAKVSFYAETTRLGVLFHPNHQWFLSTAHTEADIDAAVAACGEAIDTAGYR